MKFGSGVKYFIPFAFLAIYLIPLSHLFFSQPLGISLASKFAGVIAFLSIFTQVMLGAFRDFFKKIYNPLKVYWFHNYLGLFTFLLVLFHFLTKEFVWSNLMNIFLLNSGLGISLGVIALYVMALAVISSDLKYFFKININYKIWHAMHLLNYSLFPIIYFHVLYLGTIFESALNFYLITGLLIFASMAFVYRAFKIISLSKKINK
ncbi:MAG: ferric reductase-like transmembrane domain-containing protein [Candidatus Nanoarchaeia archaeon]|nr:ferric reductase-like transmembrane domain-containing protein [Candidatus Nanoarchaeia archaeon]MDD5053973.1 ferric reductase-like transmembrane domain-containing protein [Candidatus Nanoarchaeia archaeon]MDD5499640.1 ferric reductase-like transmembrane domain-containing protein [Candidatus Nanoarchaeia archaeon]